MMHARAVRLAGMIVPIAVSAAIGQARVSFSRPHANGFVEATSRSWGSGRLGVPLFRPAPVFLELSMEGARTPGLEYEAADLETGIATRNARAWLSLGAGRLSDRLGGHTLRLGSLGGMVRQGQVTVELTVTDAHVAAGTRTITVGSPTSSLDTLGAPLVVPTTVRQVVPGRTWRELRGRVGWSSRALELAVTGGTSAGTASHARWLRAEGTAWVTPEIAVVAGLGKRPLPVLDVRPPGGPFTLGVRIALGRADKPRGLKLPDTGETKEFEVRPYLRGVSTVRVHVPHATRVDLTADFVQWHVVTLSPAGNEIWEATLPMPPGNHHVSIRVDGGAWQTPPGLRGVADDFSGSAGLLHTE
jgi:hypothetical protein